VKLILKRILAVQELNRVDFTGVNQHRFKKSRSTSTLLIELQPLIVRAFNNDQFGITASLDLSLAFDLINIKLLLKRLKIIDLLYDIITLISAWPSGRSFYVSVDCKNSIS
jgi:hypothetical protein